MKNMGSRKWRTWLAENVRMGRNVFIFRILRRNVVERKTTKRLKIVKTEPESVGNELLQSDREMVEWSWEWRRNGPVKLGVTRRWFSEVGSGGEMVQWSWKWRRNGRVKLYHELFDQLLENNAKKYVLVSFGVEEKNRVYFLKIIGFIQDRLKKVIFSKVQQPI